MSLRVVLVIMRNHWKVPDNAGCAIRLYLYLPCSPKCHTTLLVYTPTPNALSLALKIRLPREAWIVTAKETLQKKSDLKSEMGWA